MNTRKIVFYTLVSLGTFLALVLLIAAGMVGGFVLAPYLGSQAQAADGGAAIRFLQTPALAEPAPQSDEVLATFEDSVIEIYQKGLPSVVDIEVTQHVTLGATSGLGISPPQDLLRQGEGSGFVWDTEGHLVTNYHVVKDAQAVKVIFANGTSVEAQVIGSDLDADLAVLKVNLPASALHPLVLGDSSDLKVGQLAFAIGNPYRQDFTMTSGIVSAVGRTISSGNSSFSIPEVIQTDAAINPGSSGGPLLNRQGEVIGINAMIISESGSNAGVGFAIPINIAKQILPTLIAGKEYQYAWLGIDGISLTEEVAAAMSLPADTRGALVISVAQGSPADRAGLHGSQEVLTVAGQEYPSGGDIITAIEGEPVGGIDDLITYLVENTHPGDQVTLNLIRSGGEKESASVTLGVRPND
jgi:serine protease Do